MYISSNNSRGNQSRIRYILLNTASSTIGCTRVKDIVCVILWYLSLFLEETAELDTVWIGCKRAIASKPSYIDAAKRYLQQHVVHGESRVECCKVNFKNMEFSL